MKASRSTLALLEKCGIESTFERLLLQEFKQQKSRFTLGLDINTNRTGYVVLDREGLLYDWGTIASHKSTDLLEKGLCINNKLAEVRCKVEADHLEVEWSVGIEEFLKSFHTGRFHTSGLFQLAQLNGIVSYGCFGGFQAKPIHVHPNEARSFFDLKNSDEFSTVKQAVLHFMVQQNGNDFLTTIGKTGKVKQENFDVADAYIIALHVWFTHYKSLLLQEQDIKQQFIDFYFIKNKTRLSKKYVDDLNGMDDYLTGVYINAISTWVKLNQVLFFPK